MGTAPLVLPANEPAAYRSLLASEVPFLRPNLRVLEVEPAEPDAAVTNLCPPLVICSHMPETVRAAEVAILILSTNETDTSIQPLQGSAHAIVNP